MSFNAKEFGFNVCPKCGGEELYAGAYSFSSDCSLTCAVCGFEIEEDVSWDGCADVREHDQRCLQRLKEVWNKISKEETK